MYPVDVSARLICEVGRQIAQIGGDDVGCGKPGTGNAALPGRVISAPLNPTDCAPMVSQTWAATIMQSAGDTASCSHACKYTAGAGLNARQASTLNRRSKKWPSPACSSGLGPSELGGEFVNVTNRKPLSRRVVRPSSTSG